MDLKKYAIYNLIYFFLISIVYLFLTFYFE